MRNLSSIKRAFTQYLNIRQFSKSQRKHFVFNIVLGLIVMCFFLSLENTRWGQQTINMWFDEYISENVMITWQLKKLSDDCQRNIRHWISSYSPALAKYMIGKVRVESRISGKILFLDVDDVAYKSWGRPAITPRDKIADRVDAAYQGGAKLIILDYDLGEPDYSPARSLIAGTAALDGISRDGKLYDVLDRIRQSDQSTRVIIPVTHYADMELKPPGIYASLIDGKKIYGATPGFSKGMGKDALTRFWMPYLKGIDAETKTPQILWSFPMVAMAVLGDGMEALDEQAKKIIENKIEENNEAAIPLEFDGKLQLLKFYYEKQLAKTDIIVRGAENHQYNRINYYLVPPQTLSAPWSQGLLPIGSVGFASEGETTGNFPLVYKDKIVIIGNSSSDGNDIIGTTIGPMPGMYIHGNIINTLLSEKKPHLVSVQKHIMIEFVLIVIAAYAFLHFAPLKARLMLFVLFIFCWVAFYVYFYVTEEFVNLNFSFMGIGIHDFISRVETLLEKNEK